MYDLTNRTEVSTHCMFTCTHSYKAMITFNCGHGCRHCQYSLVENLGITAVGIPLPLWNFNKPSSPEEVFKTCLYTSLSWIRIESTQPQFNKNEAFLITATCYIWKLYYEGIFKGLVSIKVVLMSSYCLKETKNIIDELIGNNAASMQIYNRRPIRAVK